MKLKIALVPKSLEDLSLINFTTIPAHPATGLYMRLLSSHTTDI